MIRELLSGVTVACAQVGESVAFAFIAHVGPLLGLHAAWISGLTTGALGSRPAMINGATGVRAAVMAPFMVKYGNQHIGYVFWIVLVISFWQFGFAVRHRSRCRQRRAARPSRSGRPSSPPRPAAPRSIRRC